MCLKLASEWLDDRIWSLSTWLNTTHMEPNVYKRTFRQLSVMIDYNIYVGTSEWFAWLDHIRLQLLEPLNSVFPNHDNGYSFETVVNSIFNCSTNRLPHLNNTFSEVSPPKPYACQPYYKQMERFLLFLTYNLPEHSTDPQDFVCGEPAPDGISRGGWFRGYIPVPVDYDADVLVYDAPQIVKSDSNYDVESHNDGDKEDNDNDSDQDEEGDSESEEDMHLLSQPQRRLLHSKFGIPERHFGHYVLVEEDDSDCSVDDEAMMEDEDIEYSTHVQHDTCEVEQEEEFEYNHDELYEDQPAHEGDQCMVVNGSEPSHGFMSSGFSNSVPTFEDNSLGVDLVVVQQQQLRHLYSAPRVFVDSSGRVHDVDEFSFQVSERIGGGHEWHVQYPNSDGGMDRYVMESSESIGLQVAPGQRVPLATLFYSPL
ncbi:hypothetical protein K435DRAFT_786357 [Dendrothele bispora CBS 962.96]|uniref:Uncharacterized protein n=1 Tax=Dendrothele bispora (strain CBS 962.96) TaxID=1314807 RepID=A0A4V4HB63_DENBC|nr:hypothetical protein K435DRAFT_786357 [Dendrothele bispora CBS 962.96]